jgi:hypothetical protein
MILGLLLLGQDDVEVGSIGSLPILFEMKNK